MEERVVPPTAPPGTEDAAEPERQFVWGLRYIDDLVVRDRDTDSNGSLNERLYACQDANWNVTSIINASAAVQERYAYSAYGIPFVLSAVFEGRAVSSFIWETLYCGYRYEVSTQLLHVRNRSYHVILGCWLQRDLLVATVGEGPYSDSQHAYLYCRAQPLDLVDPSGYSILANPIDDCDPSCPIAGAVIDAPPSCQTVVGPAGLILAVCIIIGTGTITIVCRNKKKGNVKCSSKARGSSCTGDCANGVFPAEGATMKECKKAAFAACVAAGCHRPGSGCDCGHLG